MEKKLTGKPVAQEIIEKMKTQLALCQTTPVMAIIKAGSDPASVYYTENIVRQGNKLGMIIQLSELPENTTTRDFVSTIEQNNANPRIHGIMIQKPLPDQLDEELINNTIAATKDIDGINPLNLGKLFLEQHSFVPCTAAAVMELIKFYKIGVSGKHVVILGRSPVVGKPLIGLLLQKSDYGNATVTVCHSKTKNMASITRTADIVIAAIGKPNFLIADMIKHDAICIDVGINQIRDADDNDVYVGDIDYNSCLEKASAITPVPGGVGTITTAILLNNLMLAALAANPLEKLLT
jgi:methylenetetrahydrofolate dehydrogenase (NADP+)/methenyltetrahydrofolate cyclohydrolase